MSSRTLRSSTQQHSQSPRPQETKALKRKRDTADTKQEPPNASQLTAPAGETKTNGSHDNTKISSTKPKQAKRDGRTFPNPTRAAMRNTTTAKSKKQPPPNSKPAPQHLPSETPPDQYNPVMGHTTSSHTSHLTLKQSTGDLFAAPPHTILLHACNTQGTWGAGIALAFKTYYPSAFQIYKTHCTAHGAKLLGKALLIAPQESDAKHHYIGCLFTSAKRGKGKGTPQQILQATKTALQDLLAQMAKQDLNPGCEIRMPKINSGLFGVPWPDTREVLEDVEVEEGGGREVLVISREE